MLQSNEMHKYRNFFGTYQLKFTNCPFGCANQTRMFWFVCRPSLIIPREITTWTRIQMWANGFESNVIIITLSWMVSTEVDELCSTSMISCCKLDVATAWRIIWRNYTSHWRKLSDRQNSTSQKYTVPDDLKMRGSLRRKRLKHWRAILKFWVAGWSDGNPKKAPVSSLLILRFHAYDNLYSETIFSCERRK